MRAVVSHRFLHASPLHNLLAAVALLTVTAIPVQSQTLNGQVVDSVESQPLAGIEVVLLDAQRDTVTTARSGHDGRFSFSVAAGAYTLCVRCIGRRPKQVPVEVPSEEELIVRLAQLTIPLNP
jgi:hypothetical protein